MILTQAPALDPAQLLRDLRVLADPSMEGREAGTCGGDKARAYLRNRFTELRLEPVFTHFEQPFTFGLLSSKKGTNLVGRIQGTVHPERILVLSAHYDHLGIRLGKVYPGADDNASGVAVLLALAGHFQAHPPRHTLLFAAFDAEESDLQGSRAFVAHLPCKPEQVLLDVNIDMVGRNVQNELFVTGTSVTAALRPLMENLAHRSRLHLRLGHDTGRGTDNWTNSSDHASFHAAKIPFLYFGEEDHADYHQPSDTADRIQVEFLAHAAATILDAVQTLDGLDLQRKGPELLAENRTR